MCSNAFSRMKIGIFWFEFPWMVVQTVLKNMSYAGKIARALQRECSFSSTKSNELTDQQDIFCFNHASAFYTSNNNMNNVLNNVFKADTATRNPTWSSRCHTLAPRALNMMCSFGQSARSIESRCVVIHLTKHLRWFCLAADQVTSHYLTQW